MVNRQLVDFVELLGKEMQEILIDSKAVASFLEIGIRRFYKERTKLIGVKGLKEIKILGHRKYTQSSVLKIRNEMLRNKELKL